MKERVALRVVLVALALWFCQATSVLAGTTGGLSGTIQAQGGVPIDGAKVTASSTSESASTTTDSGGHFSFVSLIPDTYTVTVSKDGYQSESQAGVTVFADNTQTVSIKLESQAKVLARVATTANVSLVRPGTTADVYSVNGATASKVTALGGGGSQDSAYSAIATVPGAYVPTGSSGWYQTVLIRGGDFDQVGYELDGIPINRSFDNYPTGGAGTLGQQELQVYTGSAPASAESQGLAGFLNQVIKTGSYPGFGSVDAGFGSPNLYNKLNLEVGGATPNRTFSYYLGLGGYSYGERFYDQHDGASIVPTWGTPFAQVSQANVPGGCAGPNGSSYASCYASGVGPGGYALGPFAAGLDGTIQDRENIANFHFYIPHHNDAGRDDIQLLYSTFFIRTPFQNSQLDWGSNVYSQTGTSTPFWLGGNQYNGALGQPVQNACAAPCNISTYQYPDSNSNPGTNVPAGLRDQSQNGQGIAKIQFQHNIGSSAYFRVYAYSYYSWWFQNAPNSAFEASQGLVATECCPAQYDLFTHTRGASASFADQITPAHLVNLELSQVTATTERDNNTTMLNGFSSRRDRFAVRVDSTNPFDGICYTTANVATTCSVDLHTADYLRMGGGGAPVVSSGVPDLTGQTCGAGPCEYLAVENGNFATYNTVRPTFTSASITDSWKPTDKLVLNLGLRLDHFQFKGSDTSGGARNFWFNAFNQDTCVLAGPGNSPVDKIALGLNVTDPCSNANTASATYVSAHMDNVTSPVFSYTSTEPRIGGTYTLDSNNVIRFNYGKYTQPPNAAFEQYNDLDQNLPRFLATAFYKFGFTTPGHAIPPENSFNTDVSIEHRFPNSDTSLKLTPFYRKSQGQFQQFFLDQATGFVSGLPAGNLTATGVELQIAKGDFNRNGLAAILSYAYTHAYINYFNLSNGGTALSTINLGIRNYNAYTQFCTSNPTAANCGATSTGQPAAPCYIPSNAPVNPGAPDPGCAAGDIANPYWMAPAQPLIDEHANYPFYSIIPGGFESTVGSNDVPHVATLVLNFKHDKWAFTPIVAFHSGNAYGAPFETTGIDPAAGCTALAGSTANDPRYPYGAAGGAPYNAMTCAGTLGAGIPDPFTHVFDSLGAFRSPSQIQAHLGISYEATPRATFSVNLVNLVNTCFGGSSEPWTTQPNLTSSRACSYQLPGSGFGIATAGNVYNPGAAFQQEVQYPYQPAFGAFNPNGGGNAQSFAATFEVKLKL